MKKVLYLLISVVIYSCSESFEFENSEAAVLFMDAKVSTLPGESYLIAYETLGSQRKNIRDLEVTVRSSSGDDFQFAYNQDLSRYLPTMNSFVGEEGESYMFYVLSGKGEEYVSTYDTVPRSLDFEIAVKDTIVLISTQSDLIAERTAKGVNVLVENGEHFARYRFSYSYQHYWTEETIVIENESQYVLFSGNGGVDRSNKVDIPIAYELRETWVFFNPLADTLVPLNVGVDAIRPCEWPYCYETEIWEVDYQLRQESLSKEAYDFWKQLQDLSENDGIIFDTFPYPLNGNISCSSCNQPVLGFFRAVSEDYQIEEGVL